MNDHLRRAVEALEFGASDARKLSVESASRVRDRVQRAIEEALDHLEADDSRRSEPEDIFDALDRQSREIAEDLRRADKLMKRRTGQE
ncbi:MAG TPA: hypothetical protein VF221_22310 [Chloroflexota bacterium]